MDLPASAFSPPPEPVPFVPVEGAELPSSAEVAVVGAGMVGAMAALRLAQRGMRPVVIEANAPASGASGRLAGMALAGLGGHFPRVTRLVREASGRSVADYTQRSLDLLEELEAELPGGFGWQRSGSVDLLLSEAEERHGRQLAELRSAEGLEVQILGPDELREVAPSVAPGSVRAARWTPGDGQLHPIRMVYALLAEATRLGASVVTGVRVERVLARSGRVFGVATSHGELPAGAVLLATNAWSGWLVPQVADNLTPIREHVCVTEPLPPLLASGFETNQCNEYWRQLASGEILIGGFTAADEGSGIGSYSMEVRPQVPPLLAELLGRIHPAAADARIVRCWAGLLDFASLEVPMVGRLPAADGTPLPGGYLACGLTGHGLPYAPILGVLLSELIAEGEARTMPLEPIDPARYVGVHHAPTWLEPFSGMSAVS
ncbi:MAG TPA: FAD-binding oxidoreductase [Candidatus Limnocylindria bacterium]|nr:FAD-binding oxidoreductase [Candidatus Limnocylindria bacterium]